MWFDTWAEGFTALVLLAGLQLVVAWLGSRVPRLRGVITAKPTVLLRDGVIDEHALHEQRLTEAEVLQAVRSSGTGALDDVAAVVLESNGTFSVIGADELGSGSALSDVPGWEGADGRQTEEEER